MTTNCGCVCKPCAEGTRLCLTSNVCINSTVWCDGVVDCPDDELDCTTSPPPTTPTTPPTTTTTQREQTCSLIDQSSDQVEHIGWLMLPYNFKA